LASNTDITNVPIFRAFRQNDPIDSVHQRFCPDLEPRPFPGRDQAGKSTVLPNVQSDGLAVLVDHTDKLRGTAVVV
jgi:hypothetical protein